MSNKELLLVEDSASLRQVYIEFLYQEGISVECAADGLSAMKIIQESPPRVMVLDLMLPDMDGMHILQHINQNDLPIDVIVASGKGSMDDVIAAMQMGAVDYLEKPVSSNRFVTTVKNVLQRSELKIIVDEFTGKKRKNFQGFVGSSSHMQLVYQTIEQVSKSNASVFISGESGTGKEVCAEAVHNCSDRKDKPFIALNCAAIPHDLVESEIFGHVKGAFTGAVKDRSGAAGQANGGTLFLDEIAEMDFDLQAKLLRFIQTQSFQKVGDSKLQKVDVRFICATNKNALEQVEKGKFREDLYYRLNVINIDMPSLRKRDRDVIEIGSTFLEKFAKDEGKKFDGFSKKAQQKLLSHSWPGNVRELQNVIRRVVVIKQGGIITDEDIIWQSKPTQLAQAKMTRHMHQQQADNDTTNSTETSIHNNMIRPLADVERDTIEHAIRTCGGNIPKAAAFLDVSPSTIYRKLQVWEKEIG